MISFSKILKEVLTEWVTFARLYNKSESGRKDRADDVRAKPMRVTTMDENEAWTFSYKSNPSTTGKRWHGYIQFNKANVAEEDDPLKLKCMVDCDCPDYRYRYAYNNAKGGAGRIGKHPDWPYGNENNGQKWRPRSQGGVGNYGMGMCKHLLALGEYLGQVASPKAPEPDDVPPPSIKKVKPVHPTPPSQKPQTMKAPEPDDDTYTDSRSGSETLQEAVLLQQSSKPPGYQSELYKRMAEFVRTNSEFTVNYENESD